MTTKQKAYRNITEASSEIGVEPHVLRYWESRFEQLKPMTRGGARRFYSIADMELIRALKQVLHVEGVPIRAVAKRLDEQGVKNFISNVMTSKADETLSAPQNSQLDILDQLIENAKSDITWLKDAISRLSAIESSHS